MGIRSVFEITTRVVNGVARSVKGIVKDRPFGPLAAARAAIRNSYESQLRMILNNPNPLPTPPGPMYPAWTPHMGALTGALHDSYRRSFNPKKAAIQRNKMASRFIVLEALPFVFLSPPQEGVEALGEYVAWRMSRDFGARLNVRLDWLRAKVREGVGEAQKAGVRNILIDARECEPQIPWVELLQEGTDTPGSYEAAG